ncbi:hypothetical protein HDU79_010945 [Rhizoclosmatium sp. JEL0117]|nr:hypothetical protein HDU79_010945 [Rhizoclosmatium sp. JEL0117]
MQRTSDASSIQPFLDNKFLDLTAINPSIIPSYDPNFTAAASAAVQETRLNPLDQYENSLVSLSSLESLADCFQGLDAPSQESTTNLKSSNPFNLSRLPHLPFKVDRCPKKKPKRGKNGDGDLAPGEEWKCVQCGAGEADTPLKRKGPDKKRNYCNACYVRWRVKVERSERGSARPVVSSAPVHRPTIPKPTDSHSSRTSLTPSFGCDSDYPLQNNRQLYLNRQQSSSTSLSLTSPTQMMGAPASMVTNPAMAAGAKSNNDSPQTLYFQSPQYSNYEWNSPVTANMIFSHYMNADPSQRLDAMQEYTPSPITRLGSFSNLTPPELGQLPKEFSFHFGNSFGNALTGTPNGQPIQRNGTNASSTAAVTAASAAGHLGIPLHMWSEDSTNNSIYQCYQQTQQQLLQQQQLQQHLQHQLEQQQIDQKLTFPQSAPLW